MCGNPSSLSISRQAGKYKTGFLLLIVEAASRARCFLFRSELFRPRVGFDFNCGFAFDCNFFDLDLDLDLDLDTDLDRDVELVVSAAPGDGASDKDG